MTTIRHARNTLEHHKSLAEKVRDTLKVKSSNSTETVYSMRGKRIIDDIDVEIQKLDQLELRMTVVASMKSGKSTFINALIGENILPTRANAMTIIPTEVILKREALEPRLFLSQKITDAMEIISRDVRKCLQLTAAKEEHTHELFENDPHMNSIVNEISQNNYVMTLKNEVTGPMEIQNSLLAINDLIRLYLKLAAKNMIQIDEINFEVFRDHLPRVDVPFSSAIIDNQNLGNLVIVDTPGPNEAGVCKSLQQIVTVELRKADIIFIVFNYTTMNTEADEELMSDIDELMKICGENSSLYALVNKVDQRREGDMSEADVKKFIRAKYGIQERTSIDKYDRRIFEIKAYFGLIAKRFLLEYERLRKESPDFNIQHMQTADDLGSVLYDFNWETMQGRVSKEKLHKGATDMWKKSGLDELLQAAIYSLMHNISIRLVQSSLSKCQRVDRELIECLKQRLMVLNGNTDNLNVEIRQLEEEMNLITKIQNEQFLYLEPFWQSLLEEFKVIDMHYPPKVRESVLQWLEKRNYRSDHPRTKENLASGLLLGGAIVGSLLIGGPAAVVVPGISVAGAGLYHWYSDTVSNSLRIPNARDAIQTFEGDVTAMVAGMCETISIRMQERVHTGWKQLSDGFYHTIYMRASELLQHAEQVLNIPFKTTQPKFSPLDMHVKEGSVYEVDPGKYSHTYPPFTDQLVIPCEDLIRHCAELVKNQVNEMQKDVESWYGTFVKTSFSEYLAELREYLDEYMNIVQSSLSDTNLSNTDQQNLRDNIEQLIATIEEQLEKLTDPQHRIFNTTSTLS